MRSRWGAFVVGAVVCAASLACSRQGNDGEGVGQEASVTTTTAPFGDSPPRGPDSSANAATGGPATTTTAPPRNNGPTTTTAVSSGATSTTAQPGGGEQFPLTISGPNCAERGATFDIVVQTKPTADVASAAQFSDNAAHDTDKISTADAQGSVTVSMSIPVTAPTGKARVLVSAGRGGAGASGEHPFTVMDRGRC